MVFYLYIPSSAPRASMILEDQHIEGLFHAITANPTRMSFWSSAMHVVPAALRKANRDNAAAVVLDELHALNETGIQVDNTLPLERVLNKVAVQATEQEFKQLLEGQLVRVREWKATQHPAPKPSLIVVARPILIEVSVAALSAAALIWIAFKPEVFDSGVARVVALFVLAMFIAIAITNRIAMRVAAPLDRRTALSALAATLLVAMPLFVLVEVTDGAQPNGRIAVFKIDYDDGNPVLWFRRDVVTIVPASAKSYVDGNTLVVQFPKGVQEATLTLRDEMKGIVYSRTLSNEKEETTLIVPDDFKRN